AIPEGREVTFGDLVKGEARFAADDLRDFVIRRSDGTPTYLLASGVDDLRMRMTHVIRGEDLFPSTPRQLLMFEALGEEAPAYAHLPLILGPDRAKLSKRHGAVAVEWFREHGFLPEALVNYLALLGWSPGTDEELFPREELVRRFDLADVSHHPAVFDTQKLEWMNGHYIRDLPTDELAARLATALGEAGIDADLDTLRGGAPLVAERMRTLAEGPDLLRFLFVDDLRPDEKAEKMIRRAGPEHLRAAAGRLASLDRWDVPAIEGALTELQEASGLSRKDAWQPIRAAVTGSTVSPPLFESIELLGRERTLARLGAAADLAAAEP
ncbi:MAG: glutamate--tRNA ligase, partial [Actinobacteria bacterium]|nr:glutamate--tRNA ligase [Actinomycetota bacterium]